MKKTYTKKQITEAIAYWKKQLKKMNENTNKLRQVKITKSEERTADYWIDYISKSNSIAYIYIQQGFEYRGAKEKEIKITSTNTQDWQKKLRSFFDWAAKVDIYYDYDAVLASSNPPSYQVYELHFHGYGANDMF